MRWKNTPKSIEEYVGFVYVITNKKTGRKYVGKKIFRFKKRLKRKGKRDAIQYVESDWRTYNGSCGELLQDISEIGIQSFSKEIVMLCKNKWEMAYYEAKMQFDNDVLLSDKWYNGWIKLRLGKRK